MAAALVLCWALAGVAPALAASGHGFVSSVSEAPLGTALQTPGAVAVDRASGDLFVGDRGAGMVDMFDASGAFVAQFGEGRLDPAGIGLDEARGLVYVADARADAVVVFKADGSGGYRLVAEWFGQRVPGGEFGSVSSVAVDNSASVSAGDVYVLDGQSSPLKEGAVDVFQPNPPGPGEAAEGALVRQLTAGKMERPNGVTVSPTTGRVLVADDFKGAIYTYSAEGASEEKLDGKGSPYGTFAKEAPVGDVAGVAIAEVSGDVYVAEAERHAVSQYGASGEWQGWITTTPTGDLSEPRGAAAPPSGELLVTDAGAGVVDRFGAAVAVPGVETGKVAKSAVTRTTAQLSGAVNGEGEPASYRFQYGETAALGSATATKASGTGQESVSAPAEGLHAGKTYYYRISAEDRGGVNYGAIRQLQTPPAVEALETGEVGGMQPTGARLTGSLERGGLQTHYFFQYGASEAYGATSPQPAGEVPAGKDEREEKQPKTLEGAVSGLQPNTLYHYRLVAENEYGATYGADRTFTTSGPPGVVYEPTTGIGQTEATIHASVEPDQLATTYRFEYGESTGYGTQAPGGELGSGQSAVAVSAALSSLRVGRTYHFRIVAENEAGTTYGADQTFTTVASAPVDASYATGVSVSDAILHARVNPHGHDTRFYFQYGTGSCQANPGACTDAPLAPGEDIGEGSEDAAREAKLSGLTPGTAYHYRVIAANSLGVSEGREGVFETREEGALALPDHRAWEMVTPPDKGGAPVEPPTREGGLILASEDGDALAYVIDGALGKEAQGNRSPEMQQVLARRTPQGWSSQDIATPTSKPTGLILGQAPEYQFFTPTLSTALVEPLGAKPEPPLAPGVTQATMYLRDNQTGSYLPLVTGANTTPGTVFGGHIHFVSATPDLSHVVIQSSVALTGGRSAPGLYEWSGGELQFLSALPGGKPAFEPEVGYLHDRANAITRDGSRMIWTVPAGAAEAKRGHLYMRDTPTGETIQLDAAQGVAEPAEGSAQFQTASSDGSRVFFTDKRPLTPDATPEAAQGEGEADLYMCEIVERSGTLACVLKDLTVDRNPGEHAAVRGLILGASEDGKSVFFIARGVLASNANGNHETAHAGANNLYGLRLLEGRWTTAFIASLSNEDSQEWEGFDIANTAYLSARVSPNGRYLAFMSAAPITGYDNVDANPEANGARDEEVFLYDSQTANLRCVSCNVSGARPEGVLDAEQVGEGLGLFVDRRGVWLGHRLGGSIPGWTAQDLASALFQSRYLSDEGRLYFNSPDDLVPAATNHKEDVYEYEPAGVGSCESSTGGCVALISGGGSDRESAFLEANPNGSNVFFVTEARLLPQDTDTAFDVYDARECTTLSPCLSPSAGEGAQCAETQTCRPASPPSKLPLGSGGSATASGPGNLPAPAPVSAKTGAETNGAVKRLTRSQMLTRAVRSCRKRYPHSKTRRTRCERVARKRYGTAPRAGRASRRGR